MKRQILKTGIAVVTLALLATACKKDKGETNEEEVITTMILTCTPQGGGTPLVFTFNDPDGPGGTSPTQDDIVLDAGTAYDVELTLLNATENPPENVTEEIDEENDAHRFYYQPSAGSNITVSNLDNDDNGIPLGITSTWTTTTATTGTITITLRHYPAVPPNKEASDPVNSTKSGTDIEVTFNTTVQ